MIWSPNANTWHLFGVINGIFIQQTICRRTASIFDWNLAAHTVPVGKRLGLRERGARWATFSSNTNIFKIDGLTQLKFCLGIVCEVFSKVSKSTCTHHAMIRIIFNLLRHVGWLTLPRCCMKIHCMCSAMTSNFLCTKVINTKFVWVSEILG